MSDFFYRECSPELFKHIQGLDGGRIRNNAYIQISSEKDPNVVLPIKGKSMTETYDPQGTGRPAPLLKEITIKLQGDAGSLRRIEGGFICYDTPTFEKYEDALLVPGRKIKVKYGYVGPETPSESAEFDFTIYDYSFSITKENYFDCSFKGIGPGGTYEENNINTQAAFPNEKFITNYDGINDAVKVGNLFDYIDYALQKSGHPAGSFDNFLGAFTKIQTAIKSRGGTVFNPGHGTSGTLMDGTGGFAFLKAPEEYNSPTAMEGGVFVAKYLQYITLGALVNMINKFSINTEQAKEANIPTYEIIFDPVYSKIQTHFPSGLVWSADPIQMLFPYKRGTKENTYGDYAELSSDRDPDEYVSIDHIKRYEELGPETGDPKHILISRDLIRAIQKGFNDKATKESSKEESEKADSTIKLKKFMDAVFAAIRVNSGGAWDFYLDQDDTDKQMKKVIIINKKSPGSEQPVKELELNPTGGKNGIRELKIEASVPKEFQAAAFGGAPDVTNEEELTVNTIKQEEQSTVRDAKEGAMDVAEQNDEARKAMTEGEYATSVISKAKAALNALVNEMSAFEKAQKGQFKDGAGREQVPFPLSFSATLDGVEGFKFGDTISTSFLPSRYREPYGPDGKEGNIKIVFTVTEYEHKIANNDWTTTVKALMRIRPE